MYTENVLVRLAKRENNNKRGYLVVNPLQGKHIPVIPSQTINLFEALADQVKQQYPDERLLLIGFAETATAIGAALAVALECDYIQTTREIIPDASYFYFSEAHSHATEQKLVRDDINIAIERNDRVIFVEDEVTTGNTILNIVTLMKAAYPGKVQYSVASLLNGMNQDALAGYQEQGIALHYLVKTCHDQYGDRVAGAAENGTYVTTVKPAEFAYQILSVGGSMNARRLVNGAAYERACQALWEKVSGACSGKNQRILVLGTEEFMYPALYTAWKFEQQQHEVRFHATTRSPIAVSCDEGYPLSVRYELRSLYDDARITYIYNLKDYDKVFLITDAACTGSGVNSVINALAHSGNDNITLVKWGENEKFL